MIVVPPFSDPSLRLEREDVLDLNARFVTALVRAAVEGTLTPAPGAGGTGRLLLSAGRAALRRPQAGLHQRLRGLGAVLAATRSPSDAIELRLDDLELVSGTTEHSDDVLTAAKGTAPYDDVLREAAGSLPGGGDLTVLLERDQQLPAVVALLRLLGERPVQVTGRYATDVWPRLRLLAPFAQATLDPAPRGLPARVVDPFTADAAPGPWWRERAADPLPPPGWAGRIGLDHLLRHGGGGGRTLVLGLCATPLAAIGRGGTTCSWESLSEAVARAHTEGARVVAEVWLGAPHLPLEDAPAGLERISEVVDRVAAVRQFDWPVGWRTRHWGGYPVTVRPDDDGHRDLARHLRLPEQDQEAVGTAAGPLLERLARSGHLLPGRIAAAYLTPLPGPGPADDLDPDVVVAGKLRSGRVVLMNLRTGTATEAEPAMAALASGPAPAEQVRAVLNGLTGEQLARLRERAIIGSHQ